MTTQEINSKLQIVNVTGKRFVAISGSYRVGKGYAFYVPELGYLTFKDSPHVPYIPCGGLATLQSILDTGGMVNYDTITFVNEL